MENKTFVTKDPRIWWETKRDIFIRGASAYKISVTNTRSYYFNYDFVICGRRYGHLLEGPLSLATGWFAANNCFCLAVLI